MAHYTIRIELNGPPKSEIYDAVHEAMSRAGYERWIQSDKGGYWKLPDGMYDGTSARHYTDERDAISAIVKATWSSSEIIVFRYDEAAWVGLDRLTDDTQG